jgi:DHA1 family multidrug resistance protein-like MFS transporter
MTMRSLGIFFEPLKQDRRLNVILIMIACVMMGNSFLAPILSLYMQSFGVGQFWVGALVTVFGLGRILGNLPAGVLSQRIGRKPLLIGGPALVAVSSVAAALTDHYGWLIFWRLVQGVGSGIYVTASMAALADLSPPERRAANVALYQSSLMVGATIGPVFGGYAAETFGFTGPFWLYALMMAIAAAFALRMQDTLEVSDRSKPGGRSAYGLKLMSAAFLAVCIVSLMSFFTRTTVIFQLIPLVAHDRFGMGLEMIGMALTVNSIFILAVMPLASSLTSRFGARRLVFWSTVACAAVVWMLYASPSLWLYWVAVMLFGVMSGLTYPAIGVFMLEILAKEHYGAGSGLQRSFGDVGFVIGPLVMGALSDLSGGGQAVGSAANALLLAGSAFWFLLATRGARTREKF